MISEKEYNSYKEGLVHGRYVTNDHILPLLERMPNKAKVSILGQSVEKQDIYSITIGTGAMKLLFWSQMHGNESTTTKAVFDFLNFLRYDSDIAQLILANCTLKMIPILNPDGARAYTRVNANEVDLNRDAQELTQPESLVLRKLYDEFQPDFCFNLHDQRTIFNVGTTNKPATLSFLAPSKDVMRTISTSRAISMKLIVAINKVMQQLIPGQIGRYDDAFNANCVGDTFQMLQTPTVLFEAGHFENDYQREVTRKYVFQALVSVVSCIAKDEISLYEIEDYELIPENKKLFFDVMIKNAHFIKEKYSEDLALLFVEKVVKGKIKFDIKISQEQNITGFFAHKTYDCSNKHDFDALKKEPFWKVLSSKF